LLGVCNGWDSAGHEAARGDAEHGALKVPHEVGGRAVGSRMSRGTLS
jgi:hypothetical protein